MLVEKITSRQNPLVKRFRRVRAGGERHLLFIEGIRLVEEAIRAGVHFETVAFTNALESSDRGLALIDELRHVPCRGAHVTPQILEAIADTESPQGVAALITRPYFALEEVFAARPQLLVVADQLQDPGNLGTLIRTAEAAGATGVITTRHSVDPFNHKALRGSMGSAFRLPIATDAKRDEVISACRDHGVKIIATRSPASQPRPLLEDAASASPTKVYTQTDFKGPVALVLGREASGIPEEVRLEADAFAQIPMAGEIESLNVAAAGAVLLYEAARQRKFKFNGSKPRSRKA